MNKPRGRSLKSQLALLCLGLLIPTLIFVGVLFWRLTESETYRAQEEAIGTSRALANALDREVDGVLTTLQALSTSPSLQAGDLAAFYDQITEIRRKQHIHISLRDVDWPFPHGHQGSVRHRDRRPRSRSPSRRPARPADRRVCRDRPVHQHRIRRRRVFQIIASPGPGRRQTRPTSLAPAWNPSYLGHVFRPREPAAGLGRQPRRPPISRSSPAPRIRTNSSAVPLVAGAPDPRVRPSHFPGPITAAPSPAPTASSASPARRTHRLDRLRQRSRPAFVSAPLRHSLLLLLGLGAALDAVRRAAGAGPPAGASPPRSGNRLRSAADAIGRGQSRSPRFDTPDRRDQPGRPSPAPRSAREIQDRARERDAAEASVRDSEAHLSGIFAQTGGRPRRSEMDGRIISANDHYCTLVGRTRGTAARHAPSRHPASRRRRVE